MVKEKPIDKTDYRVVCHVCKKKMVPRLIIYRGEVQKSVCPYCQATFLEKKKSYLGSLIFFIVFILVIGFLSFSFFINFFS